MWPPVGEISASTLSSLFSEVNADDIFSTCEIQPGGGGATFDGEVWDYTINGSTVRLRWWGEQMPSGLYARIRQFLDGTRLVAMDNQIGFFAKEIRVFGDVPEGKGRNVGDVVKKKLLKGMKADDRDSLIGLASAGLTLVGGNEGFAYQARIEPQLSGDLLTMFAGLKFRPQNQPPQPGTDLDLIENQTQMAVNFVENDLVDFSRKLFT